MIGKKAILYTINGIYGKVDNTELAMDIGNDDKYYKSRHGYQERDIKTGEVIEISKEIPKLPLDITMDEYFKMALMQAIQNIKIETASCKIDKDDIKSIKDELGLLNRNLELLITSKGVKIKE